MTTLPDLLRLVSELVDARAKREYNREHCALELLIIVANALPPGTLPGVEEEAA